MVGISNLILIVGTLTRAVKTFEKMFRESRIFDDRTSVAVPVPELVGTALQFHVVVDMNDVDNIEEISGALKIRFDTDGSGLIICRVFAPNGRQFSGIPRECEGVKAFVLARYGPTSIQLVMNTGPQVAWEPSKKPNFFCIGENNSIYLRFEGEDKMFLIAKEPKKTERENRTYLDVQLVTYDPKLVKNRNGNYSKHLNTVLNYMNSQAGNKFAFTKFTVTDKCSAFTQRKSYQQIEYSAQKEIESFKFWMKSPETNTLLLWNMNLKDPGKYKPGKGNLSQKQRTLKKSQFQGCGHFINFNSKSLVFHIMKRTCGVILDKVSASQFKEKFSQNEVILLDVKDPDKLSELYSLLVKNDGEICSKITLRQRRGEIPTDIQLLMSEMSDGLRLALFKIAETGVKRRIRTSLASPSKTSMFRYEIPAPEMKEWESRLQELCKLFDEGKTSGVTHCQSEFTDGQFEEHKALNDLFPELSSLSS